MSEICRWLHEQLAQLPMITFPFDLEELPENGIYFFYEEGEVWGHGGDQPRIVRIGSHSGQGNLRSRISETYLLDERKLDFGRDDARPADRSIFRKNLGRALLNRDGGDYLATWEIDFIPTGNRESFRHWRDIDKEKRLEEAISRLLRERFSFRAIAVDAPTERRELEKRFVGTLARCGLCTPSGHWLGRSSPKRKIRERNLWQVQHLGATGISSEHKQRIMDAIGVTRGWIADRK